MMVSSRKQKFGCVVTGVAGFVGSHLAERLLSMGYSVIGVDNFYSGYRENMVSFKDHPEFTFYERSITDPQLLVQLKERHPELRCCFHLAAIVSVPYSMEHPEETMEVNYTATLNLLKESNQLDFKAFVFAGSAAEYGNEQRLPLYEEYATSATERLSPYGEAKFLASVSVGASPRGVSLRFFNIYGPRQDPRSPYSGVISKFMDLAVQGKPLNIFGDGMQTRDFIYVSDVVDAYIAAAGLQEEDSKPVRDIFTSDRTSHIYNVGTGKTTSVLDLAKSLQQLVGKDESLLFLPERAGDIRHSQASVEAFQKATGWRAKTSLRDGLTKTLQWFMQQGGRDLS
jgi:UDP-glucose 4-epimerase